MPLIPTGCTWPRGGEGLLELSRWLDHHDDCRLVVIDTLAKIRPAAGKGGDTYAGDYADVGAIQSLATRHGIAILIIHHLRKMSADDPMDTISGTLGLSGAADGMMVLARERGQADAVLHITGRDIEDAEHALQWDGPSCQWSLLGDAAQYRMSQEMRDILDVLADGPKFPKAIADMLGKNRSSIRSLLLKMARDGEVMELGGLYTLITGNRGNSDNTGNTGNSDNSHIDDVAVAPIAPGHQQGATGEDCVNTGLDADFVAPVVPVAGHAQSVEEVRAWLDS